MEKEDHKNNLRKHRNANQKCHNPFEIHPNPNRRYSGLREVSLGYANKYAHVGIYKGQRLCTICRKHLSENYGGDNDKVIPVSEQAPLTNEISDLTTSQRPEENDVEKEIINAHNVDTLRSINSQLENIPILEILNNEDQRIRKEVRQLHCWEGG